MVIPNPDSAPLEVRDASGQVIAYLVPAEQMNRMRAELDALRAQVATLQRQKNHYVAELTRVLKTWIPIPPSEEEVLAATDNSAELHKLIADLESR